jgi:integrase
MSDEAPAPPPVPKKRRHFGHIWLRGRTWTVRWQERGRTRTKAIGLTKSLAQRFLAKKESDLAIAEAMTTRAARLVLERGELPGFKVGRRWYVRPEALDAFIRTMETDPFVGEGEIRKLLAAASPRLRPIIAILADTGFRRGELLSLTWSDVDLERGAVLVRHSKTGRGREVPLTARAKAAFIGIRASRGAIPLRGEDLVFSDLYTLHRAPGRKKGPKSEFTPRRRAEVRLTNQFAALAKSLEMKGVSLHVLRHSCASRMVMAGVPLSAVALVTGHSTLRCAALYGRHTPQGAARLAIQALEAATPDAVAGPAEETPKAPTEKVGEPVVAYPAPAVLTA